MLLPCQVPQPMDRVKLSPLSKPPPFPKVCAMLTSTRAGVELFREPPGMRNLLGVDADRVALSLELEDLAYPGDRVVEVRRAVHGEDEGELLVREPGDRVPRRSPPP